eukprot:SAG31_NODE_49_length_30599_cov_15.615016_1_plen_59_part_10
MLQARRDGRRPSAAVARRARTWEPRAASERPCIFGAGCGARPSSAAPVRGREPGGGVGI